jgi:transposase
MEPDAIATYLSVDECAFHLNFAPTYAYAKKGERAIVSRPGSRGQRITLVLCIAPSGYVAHKWIDGSAGAKDFVEFLDMLPRETTIVLDNASTHHAKQSLHSQHLKSVAETAADRDQRLLYIPAYSPELNPIELCFNVLKARVRQTCSWTRAKLFQTVEDTLRGMEMDHFFGHAWGASKTHAKECASTSKMADS